MTAKKEIVIELYDLWNSIKDRFNIVSPQPKSFILNTRVNPVFIIDSGETKLDNTPTTASLAAAAHEDVLLRPAAGKRAKLGYITFNAAAPAGAGSGNHEFSVFITDGTTEVAVIQMDCIHSDLLNFTRDSSTDTGVRPDGLDRPILSTLFNMVFTHDVWLIARYFNDTDVATTRERITNFVYMEE